jgi:hypothetical protein
MPLASGLNQIDDATHACWDETVLETANVEPSSPFLAACLLATIVSVSEGLLDSKYIHTPAALHLLKEHPDLTDKLGEAWKAGTFREIRSLRVLSPPGMLELMSDSVCFLSPCFDFRNLPTASPNFQRRFPQPRKPFCSAAEQVFFMRRASRHQLTLAFIGLGKIMVALPLAISDTIYFKRL